MLAHNSLVVLESASLTALTLMAAVLAISEATTATTTATTTVTTTSTTTSTSSLEVIAFSTSTVHAASHCVSTASSHSTTATSATLVLIEPLSTARHATLAKVLSITTTWCAIMTTASAIATTILVTITAATATIATAPAVVIVSTTLVTVLHVALRAASIPSRRLLLRVAASHSTALAATRVVLSLSDHLSASLRSHVLWDRVIDVAKLSVSMGILAILIPLTVAFVFKVATLLSLESLIDLALFERLATWDLLLAGHAWHWLLAGHLLLVLLGHGHLLWLLLRVANQLLTIGIAVDGHGHERLLGDSIRLRRRRLELLLGSGLLYWVLLLRL